MKAVVPAYEIASQAVFSEGLAAFFDVMLEWDGESVGVCDEFSQRFSPDMPTFAVVDIGGKTTDIVYGTWSGQPEDRPKLNVAMSESLTAGILHAADHLADGLKRRFGIKTVRDAEQNLGLRSFKVYGEKHDISDLCRQATTDLFAKIRNGVLRHADDGSGLACVVFVGGGAEVLKDDMAGLFPPSMVIVPPKPSFANARGMLKLMLTAA